MKKLLFSVAFLAFAAFGANAQCTKSSKACCSKDKMGTAACPNPTGGTASATTSASEVGMVKKVAATSAEAKPACCAHGAAKACNGEKATKTASAAVIAPAVQTEMLAVPTSNNNN